jgi:hypothetical protein
VCAIRTNVHYTAVRGRLEAITARA